MYKADGGGDPYSALPLSLTFVLPQPHLPHELLYGKM